MLMLRARKRTSLNAVALHLLHCKFGCIHKTLRAATGMEAGIGDHIWSLKIARLAD
jgi:hypothetical protein